MQMDICSHVGFSVNDINSLHGFCMDTLESTYGVVGDFSVDELANGVTKFLYIQDDEEGILGSIPSHEKGVFQMKDECEEAHQSDMTTKAPEKLYSKCATFSCSSKILSSAAASVGGALKGEMNDDVDAVINQNPLKPVSAMKGSREKRGVTPPKKLTVKWAPDIYDPVPTSALHMVTNRPRKHGKKSKNKQKNGSKSSPRGSKGKDKKQGCKRGGNSTDMGFKLCEHNEEVIHLYEIPMDFHVGIPDLFCGSSFVNRYGSSLHLSSVAEAT